MAKGRLRNANNEIYYPAPFWPVGSIYLSVSSTNPSTYFGGTWVAFGTGRCLVGVDTSQTEFNSVEKTGGEKKHTLTVDELASHFHNSINYASNEWGGTKTGYSEILGGNVSSSGIQAVKETGGNQPHNNLQPYITVYMFKKTA